MATYTRTEAAERAGISEAELDRLVELELIKADGEDRFTAAEIRKAVMVQSLQSAGLPLEGISAGIKSGNVTLDFMDAPSYEKFSVAEASGGVDARFTDIGPVELKGVGGTVHLLAARRI